MSSPIKEDIYQLFRKAYERDQKHIQKWLVDWRYIDKRTTRYKDELVNDFYEFEGVQELEKWLNWLSEISFPLYFDEAETKEMFELSYQHDKRVFEKLNLKLPERAHYDEFIGRQNVQDYRFVNLYPVPERQRVKKVLDFGAGFGRQVNLWSQCTKDVTYIGMDAIPKSYCLQHYYYGASGVDFHEYAVDPQGFKFDPEQPGIYHIPTWRFDLIPDNSLDAVLCVQVLPEINGKLVKYIFEQFKRILKPGGMLFIRDRGYSWKPSYGFDIDTYLADNGYTMEFKPHVVDLDEIRAVPRVWRNTDPSAIKSISYDNKKRVKQVILDLDHASGGRLRKLKNKISKS